MSKTPTVPSVTGPSGGRGAVLWHSHTAARALELWSTDGEAGLSSDEAARRLAEHGPNRLPEARRRGPLARASAQFNNPLILVLIIAGVVTAVLQHHLDSAVIFGVVVINAIIGFVQEGKAESALNAVRAMLASHATVLRDGRRHQIESEDLVPGDVVLLESGDRVPADVRLTRVHNLRVEESALTGESVPVEKTVHPSTEDAGIGDRTCLAFSGTLVVYGQARGVVVATGTGTEVGQIGALVGETPSLATPLTKRLDQFARHITGFILVLGVLAFGYAVVIGEMELLEAFLVVVGLAVAAIPEGLPAIITIVLAIGTRAMANSHAIVRRLPAVETLGSVTVICTDKTGTLTRNEMTAVRVMLPAGDLACTGVGYVPDGAFTDGSGARVDPAAHPELLSLATAGLLCNDAVLHHHDDAWTVAGDPTEGALVTLALKAGLDQHELPADLPRIDEVPFESENRFMLTLHHDHHGRAALFLKGAPERVLEMCGLSDDPRWRERITDAAAHGERVLALARAEVAPGTDTIDLDRLPAFQLLGLVGLLDPPRTEAVAAVAECQAAGITVKMITGDHGVTATAIGRELGLHSDAALTGEVIEAMDDQALRVAADNNVIARANPEHKMRLVAALQARGDYVAMTGDGVNDSPALKAADIGVAMGHRGTDAARAASDLVLTDDNFATIAAAVKQGRVVFDNIKKSLLFILPTNGGEAGLILLALLLGLTMPVTVGQILWINMVTAVTLALALAFEPAEPGVMRQPPRAPTEPLITRPLAVRVAYVSVLMTLITLAAFEWELTRGSSIEVARTTAVNVLVVGEMFYLFNVRHFTRSALNTEAFTGNRVAMIVTGVLVLLQLALTYAPPLQRVFETAALGWTSWAVIIGLGVAKFLAVEAEKAFWRHRGIQRL
ncbi:HAD-IC family P-type ATPase [Nocardioides sp.]|uniref:cation-translocating P-type ATPase n=1 Tax=Nocardioides sp. TaxID=35761 RepID=UPI0027361C2F|nr:HAD-IC family P-type ATPase [Nocardioides sp.]MDP3894209.1 HAD-IC family P-type ATPase [Nocardioides sp.]